MTVTVEAYHHSPVNVLILERVRAGDSYARRILLTTQNTGEVVQFGIVRVWLHYCSPDVQREILAGEIPLGRILINHDVLRRIEPTAFVRVPTRAGYHRVVWGQGSPSDLWAASLHSLRRATGHRATRGRHAKNDGLKL